MANPRITIPVKFFPENLQKVGKDELPAQTEWVRQQLELTAKLQKEIEELKAMNPTQDWKTAIKLKHYDDEKSGYLKRITENGSEKTRCPAFLKLDLILEFLWENQGCKLTRSLLDKGKISVNPHDWKAWSESRKQWLDEYNDVMANLRISQDDTAEMINSNVDFVTLTRKM